MIYFDQHITISQLTHAHLSRILAETLVINDIPNHLLLPLAIACHYHDHGWQQWEKAPEINPKTNAPLDFQNIDITQHITIWMHSREIASHQDPLVGYLVSKHNYYLSSLTLANTINESDKETLLTFQKKEVIIQNQLLSAIQNKPSESQLNRLQYYLTIADYLSLIICLNKTNHEKIINETKLSLHKDNNIFLISLNLKNPITYTLHGHNLKNKTNWSEKIIIQSTTE
tara:strand:- start:2733 stop:3419 length:687 start_codon:yes stop_codon:yes gene_type:complete